MQIAVIGKTNTGKTTFFSAATLVDAEISNRIFTTIKPNVGIGYVRAECPCKKLGVKCNPNNSRCVDGLRLIPVRMIDVAGLVPGAHKGKGLGNQFLSDIMEAQALIHVVDISGGTDAEGNPVQPGTHNPMEDVLFLEKEIDYWILGILKKKWHDICRKSEAGQEKLDDLIHKQLSGLGIGLEDVKHALREVHVKEDSGDEDMLNFVEILRKKSKPIIIAANKIDVPGSEKNMNEFRETDFLSVPCSAESELALRKAEKEGDIKYTPGKNVFEVVREDLEERKKNALEFIKTHVLERFGSTGVQQVIDKTVYDLLGMIVVYPVANIGKLTDKKGNVLPDAFLVPKGTTLKEFAAKVHTEIAENFLGGLDLERKKIGADHELKNGDVVEILVRK